MSNNETEDLISLANHHNTQLQCHLRQMSARVDAMQRKIDEAKKPLMCSEMHELKEKVVDLTNCNRRLNIQINEAMCENSRLLMEVERLRNVTGR